MNVKLIKINFNIYRTSIYVYGYNFHIRSPIDSILEPLDSYRNFGDFDTSFVTIRDRIEKSKNIKNTLQKPIKFHITRKQAWLQSYLGFIPHFGLNGKGFGT